ncbi:MAG TPA: hypothetical protein VFF33_07130 [Ignavibacteriaceae bacterium]|nr:hypothetical protein [Ignavibacteriaceae bacterium]
MKLINLIINSLFKTLFIVFIIASFYPTTAQDSSLVINDSSKDSIKVESLKEENIIFLELVGNGLGISLNYERFVSEYFSIRIGIGHVFMTLTSYPIMVNYNIPNIPIEIGIGFITYNGLPPYNTSREAKRLLLGTSIGFKRINKNFMFKATLNPYYNYDNKFTFWAGLSAGIAF